MKHRIAYISTIHLADCDLPLLHELQKLVEVDYYLMVTYPMHQGTMIDIRVKPQSAIYPATEYPELQKLNKWISLDHVYIVNSATWHGYSWSNLSLMHKWYQHLHRQNYDLLHLTWYMDYFQLPLLGLHRKMILTVHDPLPHSSDNNIRNRMLRAISMRFIPNFILLNKSQRSDFIRTYHLSENQVFQSQLSIYTHLQYTKPSAPLCTGPYVLFIGSINPHKGIEYLCQAMLLVQQKHPDLKVVIAGKGNFYFDIKSYQHDHRFVFINRYITDEELVSLINNSAMVVCPYIDATQSGVIMSTFALCKPIVATQVGALNEMVDNGQTGILVPPRDAMALSEAIMSLLNPHTNASMAQCISQKYIHGILSWNNIAQSTLQIYTQIINRPTYA